MEECVQSGSEKSVFSWLVLALRPVTAAVSRRCEVWLSAGRGGGGGQETVLMVLIGLQHDVISKLYTRELFCWMLTPQWLCCFFFCTQLLSILRCFFSSQIWGGNRKAQTHPEGTKQGALCCNAQCLYLINYWSTTHFASSIISES